MIICCLMFRGHAFAPALSATFQWKIAGWVIALAGGAVLTSALADQFVLAYGFLVVCCVYSVGCWLTSEKLASKQPHSALLLHDHSPYIPSRQSYRFWRAVPSVLMIVFFLGCVYSVRHLQMTWELDQYESWLYPASDPLPYPESMCDEMVPLPQDSIALYLGNSRLTAGRDVRMWDAIDPQDRRIAQPILVVEQDSEGRIAIDLDVRSKDRRIIARITHNHFILNPNNILTRQRPDRSTLVVTDQEGTEVLNVRYLNPHAIHLTGLFYVVGQDEPVVIGEDKQHLGLGMSISRICSTPMVGSWRFPIITAGDGSGNHEYDYPGSRDRPLVGRKWNEESHEWELQFRNSSRGK